MLLSPGTRIGAYEVVSLLGEGGMGQVYRARDSKLNRDVALKILPDVFAADPDRLARFDREAKTLASLSHSNVAAIYGVEGRALVMELVEGEDLSAHILRGPLPLEDALPIAKQIADALEAAHENGVIHRDLKPANVKVRADGTVKVLDFGLAKAFAADAATAPSDAMNSPTLTAQATQFGVILGTAAYMAPEQAKGRRVDRRADIWAFGAVLFEMLAGRRAFDGEDVTEVMASVIKSEPQWNALPVDTPSAVRRLLRRCLEKDPKKRLRDVAEGMLQLDEELRQPPPPTMAARPRASLIERVAAPAIAALLTAAAFLGFGMLNRNPTAAPTVRVTTVGNDVLLSANPRPVITISADGQAIYFRGGGADGALFMRRLNEFDSHRLDGTDNSTTPFLSPDGEWLGFVEAGARDAQIFRVPIAGGPRTLVATSPARIYGADWGPDGTIVFGTSLGLFKLTPGSSSPVPLTSQTAGLQGIHAWPSFATSDVLLFAIGRDENVRLAAVTLSTGNVADLKMIGTGPKFLSTGHIAYATHDLALRVVPFDPVRVALTGDSVPLESGVRVSSVSAAAEFDVSDTGTLVYVSAEDVDRTFVWVDRQQRESAIPLPPGAYTYPRLSPDGKRLALGIQDRQRSIWTWEFARPGLRAVARDTDSVADVAWSADGAMFFSMVRNNRAGIYRQPPDGVSAPTLIAESNEEPREVMVPYAVLRDGSALIIRHGNALALLKLDGSRHIEPLVSDAINAALSPDERWLAYESTAGDTREVYVRPFPRVNDGVWQVSTVNGWAPVWSPTTPELFFRNGGAIVSVATDNAPTFPLPSQAVAGRGYFVAGLGRSFDVARDGRFVVAKPVGRIDPVIKIALNWLTDVQSRVRAR